MLLLCFCFALLCRALSSAFALALLCFALLCFALHVSLSLLCIALLCFAFLFCAALLCFCFASRLLCTALLLLCFAELLLCFAFALLLLCCAFALLCLRLAFALLRFALLLPLPVLRRTSHLVWSMIVATVGPVKRTQSAERLHQKNESTGAASQLNRVVHFPSCLGVDIASRARTGHNSGALPRSSEMRRPMSGNRRLNCRQLP